jgi:hypothetical protein
MSLTDDHLRVRQALIDNFNAYAQGLDSKEWPLVRACFADEVLIDYGAISAPTGDPAVPRRADDWVAILQGVINGFDRTFHAIGNHRFAIDGDRVSCRAYLKADHIIFADPGLPIVAEGEIVTVVGEYTNHYTRIDGDWKIRKSELAVHWSSGNVGLFAAAAQRVMAHSRSA